MRLGVPLGAFLVRPESAQPAYGHVSVCWVHWAVTIGRGDMETEWVVPEHVLELACVQGLWTEFLLRSATSVTAIDSSPEILAQAKARVGVERVRFIQSDLFRWTPDQRYDFIFFGFWLSHVPLDRFEAFWLMVADSLALAGRVFFVDDSARMPEELIEGESSTTIRRLLSDGTGFRLVKVPYKPAALEERLEHLGWCIRVTPLFEPFFWGAGSADPIVGL
jgi:hypothetical protein